MKTQKQAGFSLIELMITVAIIGIVASIAYPAYRDYLLDSRRVVAQGDLLKLAQWMERQYTVSYEYPSQSASLPFQSSPSDDASHEYYQLSISSGAGQSFELSATPKGPQAGDECATLTLNHLGQRSAGQANCW